MLSNLTTTTAGNSTIIAADGNFRAANLALDQVAKVKITITPSSSDVSLVFEVEPTGLVRTFWPLVRASFQHQYYMGILTKEMEESFGKGQVTCQSV